MLAMGVVIRVASGEGVLDGAGVAEEVEPQLAAISAQSTRNIYLRCVPTLDMLCITRLLFHLPAVVEWIAEQFVQSVALP